MAELQEKHISRSVISAIAMAMKGRHERTQSIAEFVSNLENRANKSKQPVFKSGWLWAVVIAVAIVAIWLMVPFNKGASSDNSSNDSDSTPKIKTFYANGVSFDMVEVEGGTFRMGATSEQGSDYDFYKPIPVHSVTLSSYYIGKIEVTQALWRAVMGNNPSWFKGDNLPVECVSWYDCQKFIRKLNALTGQHFRLPTEAEWKFACRGGNNSLGYKYSGSDNIDNVAWYTDNSGYTSYPVATKSPNELGIYDMSGNVWEWCSDWYGDYTSGALTNPKGPESGSDRVIRGGYWNNDARCCRSTNRFDNAPSNRYEFLGLRLAL